MAIKARCKLACERDLRDYTQGRVGRPPRFRLYKKKRRLRETCTFSESGHPDGRQRSASGGESVEHGGACFLGLPQIFNLWEEEEVRLLYTKRVLLVATSHFRRSVALFRKAAVRLLAGRVVRHTRICLGACSQAKTWRHKYRLVTTGCRFF